jgi:hypothetical protein
MLAKLGTGLVQDVQCILHVRDTGHVEVEPPLEADQQWLEYLHEMANRALYSSCNSWC